MRWTRVAVVLSVIGPALTAQQATQQATQPSARTDAPHAGALAAEVHYSTGGDAWFATSTPAYVALFDVSRDGVRQLYPTFTAQATELSGTSVRVDLRSLAAQPGGSSLVSLSAPVPSLSATGWPHTLLLVASTMPLRVGNSWTSNIAINNDLIRGHHWSDLDTDEGIAAIVDLVRPPDRSADVAIDRVQTATPATYASSLIYDPALAGIAYSCTDATHTFVSPTPMLGASCVAVRGFPAVGSTNVANAALRTGGGSVDTAHAETNIRPAATGPGAPRISEQKHSDVQSISDPAAIRKFMESVRARHAIGDAGSTGAPQGGQPRDEARAAQRESSRDQNHDAPRHDSDGAHGSAGPAARAQAPAPASAPSRAADARPSSPQSAPAGPIKPPTERN